MMKIDKNLESLSYLAQKKITHYIKEHNLKPGTKLPSESNLVEMLGVSRITVREALAQLKQAGIVYTIQGKGTFLKRVPVELKSGLEVLKSVTEIMRSYNYTPRTVYLPTKIIEPDDDIKEKLQLDSGEQIVTYYRKRYVDDELAVYGVDSLAVKRLTKGVPDQLPGVSMFEYLEKELGLTIETARTEITPIQFNKKMAEFLEVSQETIFILLNQVFFDSSGEPIIYSLDYYNSNVFKFVVNARREMHD